MEFSVCTRFSFLTLVLSSIRQFPVVIRSDGITVLTIRGVAAAVAHDRRLLFAFDIAVDARHPGADFIHQLTLAERQRLVLTLLDQALLVRHLVQG